MNYLRAHTLDQALAALAQQRWRILCGGTDGYAETTPAEAGTDWLDISRIAALQGVQAASDEIRIGAATSWQAIATSSLLPKALREAAGQVGSRQIRVQGTLGGNLCHAAPAADGIPPLLALDASVELVSAEGQRRLPLAAFLLGRRRTAIRPDELLATVTLPHPAAGDSSAFEKLANRDGTALAVVSAAVRLQWQDTTVSRAAIATGCASELPTRMHALEPRLTGLRAEELPAAIEAAVLPELAPLTDCRGSAGLRRHLARVAIQRACARCLERGS